jgi:ribonuclease HI
MKLQLDLPEPLRERLEAQAGLLGIETGEVVVRLLEKHLPRPRLVAQRDLFVPEAAPSSPGSAGTDPGDWKAWADGACSGNPGPGGYGVVVEGPGGVEEFSRGYRNTTNNRMELRGAIAALERIPAGSKVVLSTDSRYVVDAIEKKWVDGWRRKGWRKADGGEVKNIDLWQSLIAACAGKSVRFRWVEGHAGDPRNERCDRLAVAATRSGALEVDGDG